jgi:flagellar biosynthesis/type III secretory pathway protein FliH
MNPDEQRAYDQGIAEGRKAGLRKGFDLGKRTGWRQGFVEGCRWTRLDTTTEANDEPCPVIEPSAN